MKLHDIAHFALRFLPSKRRQRIDLVRPDPKAENVPAPRQRRKALRRLIFVLVPLAAITALVLWTSPVSEPEYKGVKLSVWLERYHNEVDAEPQRNEAMEAIQQIGSNAVPTLIRWLSASDSNLKTKLMELAERQSIVKMNFIDADEYHERALAVFGFLGPEAKCAVPELEKLVGNSNTTENAVQVLCSFGQDAMPALTRCLTNEDPAIRAMTAVTIADFQSESTLQPGPMFRNRSEWRLTLPNDLLLTLLQDSEPDVCSLAAHDIGEAAERKGVRPETAVPLLIKVLKDARIESWEETVIALGKFGPEARDAVPILLKALENDNGPGLPPGAFEISQSSSSDYVLSSLQSIGVEVSEIIPIVENHLQSTNLTTRRWALETIGKFGPRAGHAIPALLKSLSDPETRNEAVKSLNSIGAEPSEVIPILEQTLGTTSSSNRIWAATALGNYGKQTESSLPLLLQAAAGQNGDTRNAVYLAVQKIDPAFARANAKTLDVNYRDPAVVVPALIKSLSNEEALVRRVAANRLGNFERDAEAAVPALLLALNDKDKSVRAAAGEALKKIDPEAAQKANAK